MGNRNESGPSGFLVKFVDGFSSPPHIHNVSYRGVVISGLIHNDDLSAKHVCMPQGSFWTQPAGEVHITAAKGNENIAYIEIDNGPFLVRAADEAFDNGERPVNIDKSKLVWLDASDIKRIESPETQAPSNGPKMAFLWGNQQGGQHTGRQAWWLFRKAATRIYWNSTQPRLKLPCCSNPGPNTVPNQSTTEVRILKPGSYFSSEGESAHQVSCEAAEDCIIYLRTDEKFKVIPEKG